MYGHLPEGNCLWCSCRVHLREQEMNQHLKASIFLLRDWPLRHALPVMPLDQLCGLHTPFVTPCHAALLRTLALCPVLVHTMEGSTAFLNLRLDFGLAIALASHSFWYLLHGMVGGIFPAGFALTLQRVVLAYAVLAGQRAPGVPLLWPLGMYSAPGSSLSMTDVRILVSEAALQQQLQYFMKEAPMAINVRSVSNSRGAAW